MRIEAINPDTGERISAEIANLTQADLDPLTKEYSTGQQLRSHIENLSFSAEVKAILFKLAELTVTVGNVIVNIGKRIIEIGIMLAARFRHATFALIIACFLTFLISLIPLIGPLLASFLGPLIALIGIAKGAWEDLKRDDPSVATAINDAGGIFAPLAGKPV